MAREDTLSILKSDLKTKEKLIETYKEVVDMIQKGALSMQFKNTNLSGDPEAGSVEVSRLLTSSSKAYGTARAAGTGDAVADNKVTINLDQDKEIVEELEYKDVKFYGIPNIMDKRKRNHWMAMTRELDTAFFAVAESEGASHSVTGSTIVDKLESLILSIETVTNNNVNGVDRDLIYVTVTPQVYAELRNKIDTLPNPNEGGVDARYFHDVRIFSNSRQTQDAICMAYGAIGQPVVSEPYEIDRIPLSNAFSVELYYHYGTKAVMSDLIKYADFSTVSA